MHPSQYHTVVNLSPTCYAARHALPVKTADRPEIAIRGCPMIDGKIAADHMETKQRDRRGRRTV